MSKTIRNYGPEGSFLKNRDGARKSQMLKVADHYTGYVGEHNYNSKTKKFFKQKVGKRNRQILKREFSVE